MIIEHTLGRGEPELKFLKKLAENAELVIDVGANTGVYSYLMSQLAHTVLAFEPIEYHYARLRKSLPRNCKVYDVALSDRTGEGNIRIPQISGRKRFSLATISSENRFSGYGSVEHEFVETVKLSTLDKILSSEEFNGVAVNFIKMDVEGHEYAVLKGAFRTISTHKPAILLETEYRQGAPVNEIFQYLGELDYHAKCLRDNRLVPVTSEQLRAMQPIDKLPEKIRDNSSKSYVNNVVFVPA